jgi:hypothetical protein
MTRKGIVIVLMAAALAALGVPGYAKDTVVASEWAAAPMRIDGLDQDWQDATFLTDPGSKAQYAIKNDGRDLYVLFVFKDMMSSTTIEYTGMKVFFGTAGKKTKELGVLFTKRSLPTEVVIAELEKRGQPLTEAQKAELRKQKEQRVFVEEPINEKNVEAPTDPAVKTDAPAYRSAVKQRVLYCEFRIPLSRVNEPRGIGTEPGQTVKLGFEWGGMTKDIMKNMMADRAASGAVARQSQGSSDSGFRDSGGEGGYEGPDFNYGRDPRYRKHSFWIDVQLAAQGS